MDQRIDLATLPIADGAAFDSYSDQYQEEFLLDTSGGSLWLPPEYRPTCSAVGNDTLVLGHASGSISFMEFTTNCPPQHANS